MKKNTVLILTLLLLAFCLPTHAWAAKNKKKTVATVKRSTKTVQAQAKQEAPTCKAHILVNPDTGDILAELNAHESLPPASMVKLMLSYVVLSKIKNGAVKPEDVVTASASVSKIGGSQVYLKQGEQFSVSELLHAVLIQSANDAAMALAEHVGGSRDGFVELMNIEAKRIGMNESEFHSPHGLPPATDQLPDKVSAFDFSILSRALMKDFPEVLEITGKQEEGFRGGEFIMRNHNHLLTHFAGTDGLKTGFYNEAGFCVTATAKRNNTRMLAVVMGCNQRKLRDEQAAKLLSKGFTEYRSVKLSEKNAPVNMPVAVVGGAKPSTTLAIKDELQASLRIGSEKNILSKFELCQQLQAPVSINSPCGFVTFSLEGKEIARSPVIVTEDIPEGSLIDKVKNSFGL